MTTPRRPVSPLFADAARRAATGRAGLAERLRPASLDELVGQQALVATLRADLAAGRLGSLILWGPPGSGKTTLARALARESEAELRALSAVGAGVADVRAAIAAAEEALGGGGAPTLLFVDEIHRFHAGQQDALLHAVEDGRITLVGATTENPSFSINSALLSRCRVLRLAPLEPAAQAELVRRALADRERGLGGLGLAVEPAARAALVEHAGGDARVLLDTLERAAGRAAAAGAPAIAAAHVATALGERTALHDKSGDRHYDLLSALHKSLRGSDPDAAAYWVERLLVAGEDPRVVARRLVRMASEDVGLADPAALGVALDALSAVQFLGLPEGDAALVQAAVYLALAPKSDAVYRAGLAARAAAERRPDLAVPLELRNAPTKLLAEMGAGRGYVLPHDVPEGLTAQEHLPRELAGSRFYEPGGRGAEAELGRRLAAIRAARAAARAPAPPAGRAAPPGSRG